MFICLNHTLLKSRIETIPDHWRRYKVTKGMAVSQWIPNLARRLAQLENISQLGVLDDVEVWLGGLFFPEAYVTATRQAVAHRNSWSLETLHLRLDLNRTDDHEGFIVQGMFCQLLRIPQKKLTIVRRSCDRGRRVVWRASENQRRGLSSPRRVTSTLDSRYGRRIGGAFESLARSLTRIPQR